MVLLNMCLIMIREESQAFFLYLRRNKLLCAVVLFFALFAYGFPLTHFTLSIDEENALYREFGDAISVWSTQGRFGISIFKVIFHDWQTNSVTATFLAVTSLSLTSVIWAYALNSMIPARKNVGFDFGGLALALIFLTFPAHSENIGFSIMSFEIGVGWILISISSLLIAKWAILKKNSSYMLIGLLLIISAVSIYQAFLPVFICEVIFITLMYLIYLQKKSNDVSFKEYAIILLKYILVTILSLIIYKIIDKIVSLFIPKSDYVEGFFLWGKQNPTTIIKGLCANFKSLIEGDVIYGSGIILPTILLCVLIMFVFIYRSIINNKAKITARILLLLFIAFVISPFLMPILLGSPMPIRTNLVLSVFLASVWYLLYLLTEKRLLRIVIIFVFMIASVYQSQSMTQLYYSDYSRYQEDVKMANQIGYRILDLNLGEVPSKPVVFVGGHAQKQRKNIIKQEVLGFSFFEWDGGNPLRIGNFMRSLGYEYINPSEEERNKAIEIAKSMPAWPYKGSVVFKNDLVIVNLSENSERYKLNLINYEGDLKFQNKEVYNLNISGAKIDYSSDLEIENISQGSIVFKAGSIDPQFSISLGQKLLSDSFKYISFEIDSDIEGDMQIFLLQENESYSEKYSGFIKLRKGTNKIYCERPQPLKNVISLRFDPPNESTVEVKKIAFLQ